MSSVRRIISPDVPEPPPETFSNCLVVDGVAYIAGMTVRGREAGIVEGDEAAAQTEIIFGKIRSLIEAARGRTADIVKLTIFVTSIDYGEEVWRARRAFFPVIFQLRPLSRWRPSRSQTCWSKLKQPRMSGLRRRRDLRWSKCSIPRLGGPV